jgi:hypothetical protein
LEALEPRYTPAGGMESLQLLSEPLDHLTGVGFLPGGEIRWGGSDWEGGKLWDYDRAGELTREQELEVPPGWTRAEVLALSPSGRWIAAIRYDFNFDDSDLGPVYVVWKAEVGGEPHVLDVGSVSAIRSASIRDISDNGVVTLQVAGMLAYRWNPATGFERLVSLYEQGGNANQDAQEAEVRAISPDGKFIVGNSGYTLIRRPTIWTDQGPRELPTPGGPGGASSVSADGRVVGGWVMEGAVRRAAVWVDGELTVLESEPGGPVPLETTTVVSGLGGDPRRWVAFGGHQQQAWIAFDGGPVQPLATWLWEQYDVDFFGGSSSTPVLVNSFGTSGVLDAAMRDGNLHIAAHEWIATGQTNGIPPTIFYAPARPHWIIAPLDSAGQPAGDQPLDVDQSGAVVPLDALHVINALNEQARSGPSSGPLGRVDTNGDGHLSPLDALLVINYLNRNADVATPLESNMAEPEPEGEAAPTDDIALWALLAVDLAESQARKRR